MGKGPRVDCSKDKPLTQQSGKDECDINLIIERAKRGAVIEPRGDVPMYGDFTQIPTDLRDCLNTVRQADELFMSLDANVRRLFDNDPALMLDFLNDPKNREEAVKLGLVTAPVVVVDVEPDIEPVVEPEARRANSGARTAKAKPVAEPSADES